MVREDWNTEVIYWDGDVPLEYFSIPRISRLWMPYGEGRLCLDLLHYPEHQCGHYSPHPWPFAMKIQGGYYEVAHGHGPLRGAPPKTGKCRVLAKGDRLEVGN